ncbi:MAG TPA: hypothetical protein VFH59_08265 [Frateuria sp.]|uniref:hypothetical protein n=1 Tax=Frateuria sp. TaxID=2211372 RepID=UPI002D7F6B4E|nr:hypothetical protein [Frateuria sp.]HET6805416.1 hypothetical protein [Frateuria sp.]
MELEARTVPSNGKFGRLPWIFVLTAITVTAFGLRWYYLCHAQVYQPVRGDAVQYHAYAWNLVHHGVFSKAGPGSGQVVGDSFRDPGYPIFLAFWMKLFDSFPRWYAAVLLAQALLGSLTVTFSMLAARGWIPDKWLIGAGLLMAAWPHSITIDSFLLTETLFGFLCAVALYLAREAFARGKAAWTAAAGLIFGMSSLTNAVLVPFAALLAAVLYLRRRVPPRLAVILAISALVLPLAWGVRNAQLTSGASSSGRALLNLVQGSWPEYHAAYLQSVQGNPEAARTLHAIGAESRVMLSHPRGGIRLMAKRMAAAPLHYLAWYISKPALLWGWSIRMGQGDIYVYPTIHSPLDQELLLRAWVSVCHGFNPLLMLLAFAGCIGVLWRAPNAHIAPIAGLLFLYVTLLYSTLQAEPRYSIPFRGQEILLAWHALQRVAHWVATRRALPPRPSGMDPV